LQVFFPKCPIETGLLTSIQASGGAVENQ